MIKNKKQSLIVIGVFTLVMLLGTVTYAFFNYTRTGTANRISVGDIYFTSSYDEVALDGVFPIAKSTINSDSDNVMSVDVDIEGHTTYEHGIYYEITAEDVNLTVNGKNIPIGISVSSSNLDNVTLTNYEDGHVLTDGSLFANGRILASDATHDNSVDGTITIKAYLDKNRIAISDTYYGNVIPSPSASPITGPNDTYGTSNGWVNGRVVLTTDEWNSISSTPVSFKIKVEAYENDVSTLVDGQTFIGKVKKLADSSLDWSSEDNNITTFERVTEKPDTTGFTEENIISTIDSVYTIYAWYENGIIKYYSESDNIKANKDMTYMFALLTSLEDIGDLASLDMTNVTIMYGVFAYCTGITSLSPIANWNVSNVTSMNSMFNGCTGITSLSPLANWNVSNVTIMSSMFSNCTGITSLSPLTNWNVSNVTSIVSMFSGCIGIVSLSPIANWNISNITSMTRVFSGCTGITSLSPLANWDVSNIATMVMVFNGCTGITSLSPLENWNVSNVTTMSSMFAGCTGITSLEPLANWNVSNVSSMASMFNGCTALSDASGINDWDINRVKHYNNISSYGFTQMFKNTPSHPEFTKRVGTWDSQGTFTPSA